MISVIVPVYKVEPYIRKCIDSIINQTYRDLEILLVDDCSPDRCGEICDEYAEKDSRIRVFHLLENRGLSAARNEGLDGAHGDWIMFVDSDDWIEPEFCSTPLKSAQEYNADLVAFRNRNWKNGEEQKANPRNKSLSAERPCGIVTRETAVEYGGINSWNKLYSKKLFEGIWFPEGRVYEDIATTHKLMYRADRIVLIPDILYNHLHRPGSISQEKSEKYKRDGFISAFERYEFLNEQQCQLEKHQSLLWSYTMAYVARVNVFKDTDRVMMQAAEVMDSIPVLFNGLSVTKKLMLFLWKIDRRLFFLICKMM